MSYSHVPASRALPRPQVAPSGSTPLALALVRLAGRAYARHAMGLDGIELARPERLVNSFRDFHEGKCRLILAFRHPYGDEPQLFSILFDACLPAEARKLGVELPRRPHARFLHGYEVPLWSDAVTRWILPRTGALPVHHVKFDGAGMARIREVLRDGLDPIALAPEGQVSYRSETLPRIEQGTARLGLWCAEELAKAGTPKPVLVLPLSVHYRFDESGIGKVEAFLAGLERGLGVAPPAGAAGLSALSPPDRKRALASRIADLDLALLGIAEDYYGLPRREGAPRDTRHADLLEAALRRGEAMLGLGDAGDRITRVYRIRHEGWDRIFPEGGLEGLAPHARALADRRAGEAWYAMRHMELVDLGHYLDSEYLTAPGAFGRDGAPDFGRLVEAAQSLGDLAERLVGGNLTHRPSVLRKRAFVTVAEPVDLSRRLDGFRKDRRAATEAATSDLAAAYEASIAESLGILRQG